MIYFLTESGVKTGLGHLYRSVNLSNELKKKNKIKFILYKKNKRDNDNAIKILKRNKIDFQLLNNEKIVSFLRLKNKNIIIFDVPKINLKYLDLAKKNFFKSIIVDDENNLKYYNTDIIINQNSYANKLKYRFKNKNIIKLFGARYTILPKEKFSNINSRKLDNKIKNIFLIFGGTDVKNFYQKIGKKIKNFKLHINISNKIISHKVRKLRQYEHIKFYNSKNVNQIIKNKKIDLILSCCGSGLYQMFLHNIPLIGFMCAENQKNAYKHYGKIGAIISSNLINLKKTIKKINLKTKTRCIKEARKLVNIKGNSNISKIINREINEY
jgi:UDP-2,4-diacetamido-2,4,6-trideoxy-beta-L-altropyranose hydrolase